MTAYQDVLEIAALNHARSMIRIPNQIDVPVTDRIISIIDAVPFQRLKKISQLGLVASVYPAANHNRFEHSLGVYRMTLLFLKHFSADPAFTQVVDQQQAEAFILAGLLHDIGHWPFCHPIEDINLAGIPSHENYAQSYVRDSEIATCIDRDWQCDVDQVLVLIQGAKGNPQTALIQSLLSGPIDVDKMDYLYRDSLHAGVPYGQNFDSGRLIGSLCVNAAGDRLAITEKGRTAAELMVFARYVMFSEVYWHHAVRSATAMLQRAFFESHNSARDADFYEDWFPLGDTEFVQRWHTLATPDADMFLRLLFGPQRRLFKRVAQFSGFDSPTVYRLLAHQPYGKLVDAAEQLANKINHCVNAKLTKNDLLIDAPPVGLEVQFDVDVFYKRNRSFQQLGDVSPVVNTLATRQFDDYVKQVRVFIHPDKTHRCDGLDIEALLVDSIGG